MIFRGVNKKKTVILILGVIIIGVFCHYENHHLVMTQYVYKNEKLPVEFDGYRIVQLSDLHNAQFGKDNAKLIEKMALLSPDMIVITGDIVDSDHSDISRTVQLVEELCKLSPVYYVTGNHEYWLTEENRQLLLQGIENAGAVVLDNEAVEITASNDAIAAGEEITASDVAIGAREKVGSSFILIGLDDEHLRNHTLADIVDDVRDSEFDAGNETANDVSKQKLTILLAHEPQNLDKYAACGVDVVLTGHAHGGQFRIPYVGGLIAPDQGLFPEYTEGEHKEADTTMYINRGLGNSVIPVRFLNDPEIVYVDLVVGK